MKVLLYYQCLLSGLSYITERRSVYKHAQAITLIIICDQDSLGCKCKSKICSCPMLIMLMVKMIWPSWQSDRALTIMRVMVGFTLFWWHKRSCERFELLCAIIKIQILNKNIGLFEFSELNTHTHTHFSSIQKHLEFRFSCRLKCVRDFFSV